MQLSATVCLFTRSRSRQWLATLTSLMAVMAICVLGLVPRTVSAEDKVAAGVTYFVEPAPTSALHIIHPQFSYSQDYTEHVGLDLGYDADIVTGATPQVFGSDVLTGATPFKDTRHSGQGSLRFMSDHASLSLGGGYAGEKDYRSATFSVGASADMFNRNTTIAIGYTHNFDRVCDAANTDNQELIERNALQNSDQCFTDSEVVAKRKVNIDTVQLTLTQVLTPTIVMQAGLTGQLINGFQSNPYRQVQLGPQAVQEHVPDTRNRIAYFLRGKFALKPVRGAIEATLRGYADNWAIESFSGTVAWDQYLLKSLSLRIRARYHVQDSALFYRDGNKYAQGGAAGQYWTGDRELSALSNLTAGAKVTYRWVSKRAKTRKFIDSFEVNGKADLLFYRSLTKEPAFSPNFERTKGLLDAMIFFINLGLNF